VKDVQLNVWVDVRVQQADFDAGAELGGLMRSGAGGIGSFIGVVRGAGEGGALTAMTLEHYPAMTLAALRAIVAQAQARWPLLGCTVIHRVGRLVPGAQIVFVGTASAHRQAALESCGFLIDWLKTAAPFWKCEEFADGRRHWVQACAADEVAAAAWTGGG
jgi:molybdopterin synthase catalytic subunit